MIRPKPEIEYPIDLGIEDLDGVEELGVILTESAAMLRPCPCCGRKNPRLLYWYRGETDPPILNHGFVVECPGHAMPASTHNPKLDGCGLRTETLWATEDEGLADFKDAIRYITEAWNRRS